MLSALRIAVNTPSNENLGLLEKSISDIGKVSRALASPANNITHKEASVLLSAAISREHQGAAAAFTFLYDEAWKKHSASNRDFRSVANDVRAIDRRLTALENAKQGAEQGAKQGSFPSSIPLRSPGNAGVVEGDEIKHLKARIKKLEDIRRDDYDILDERVRGVEKAAGVDQRLDRLKALEDVRKLHQSQIDGLTKTLKKQGDKISLLNEKDEAKSTHADSIQALSEKIDTMEKDRALRKKTIDGHANSIGQLKNKLKQKVTSQASIDKQQVKIDEQQIRIDKQQQLIEALRLDNEKLSGQLGQMVGHNEKLSEQLAQMAGYLAKAGIMPDGNTR